MVLAAHFFPNRLIANSDRIMLYYYLFTVAHDQLERLKIDYSIGFVWETKDMGAVLSNFIQDCDDLITYYWAINVTQIRQTALQV